MLTRYNKKTVTKKTVTIDYGRGATMEHLSEPPQFRPHAHFQSDFLHRYVAS